MSLGEDEVTLKFGKITAHHIIIYNLMCVHMHACMLLFMYSFSLIIHYGQGVTIDPQKLGKLR